MNFKLSVLISMIIYTNSQASIPNKARTLIQNNAQKLEQKTRFFVKKSSNFLDSLHLTTIAKILGLITAGKSFNTACTTTYNRSRSTYKTPFSIVAQDNIQQTLTENKPLYYAACLIIGLKGINRFVRHVLKIKNSQNKNIQEQIV